MARKMIEPKPEDEPAALPATPPGVGAGAVGATGAGAAAPGVETPSPALAVVLCGVVLAEAAAGMVRRVALAGATRSERALAGAALAMAMARC
jgi:hypothetical protein